MQKIELNIIMHACRKYGVSSYSRIEGDLYLVIFKHDIEFRNFKAAKLMVNALILEKREKDKRGKTDKLSVEGLNFNSYPTHKKREYETGSWAENRIQSHEVNEKSRPSDLLP